jgi:hypothetical protein
MIHEPTEELPWPRTPHLGQGAAPWISYEQQQQQQQQEQQRQQQLIPMTRPALSTPQQQQHNDLPPVAYQGGPVGGGVDPRRSKSNPSQQQHHHQGASEDETASLTSFKTCPSDPNLMASLVPRQISDNYEELSRQHRSRDPSVLSGGSDVTLSASTTRVPSKRSSVQSEVPLRSSAASTPLPYSRPRLKETDY